MQGGSAFDLPTIRVILLYSLKPMVHSIHTQMTVLRSCHQFS